MVSEPANGSAKKPFQLKKPLFNKPSWAAPRPIGKDEDIFSRSGTSYPAVVEKEEMRREKRAAKIVTRKEEQKGKRRDEGHQGKKRRIAILDRDEDESQSAATPSDSDDSQSAKHPIPRSLTPSRENGGSGSKRSKTPRTTNQTSPTRRRSTPTQVEPFEIQDDENDGLQEDLIPKKSTRTSSFDNHAESSSPVPIFRKTRQPIRQVEQDSDEDLQITAVTSKSSKRFAEEDPPIDDEFAEFAQQARERARRVRLGLEVERKPSQTPVKNIRESSVALEHSLAVPENQPPQSQQPQLEDPIIEILVTSPLPGTEHIIVKKRLSERLRDVRMAWCRRQEYSDVEAGGIILTYRRRRVFDFNTCKSFGAEVDEEGRVLVRGDNNELADTDKKIHLEAMNEDMYAKHEQEEERKRHMAQKPPEEEEEDEKPPEPPAPKEPQKRIVLKAKDLQDFKLIVKNSTTISRIMETFRAQRSIEDHMTITLMFDGDRLDPESTVGQTDIDDLDNIEVYVR